jgi:hypothetical protein
VLLAGCNRLPEWYPPPEQRQPLTIPEPPPGSIAVKMNDTDAPEHFVKDISAKLEGTTWRWTQKRPTLKILLIKTRDLKFVADFTIWEGTMTQTGPVTISFFIDEKLLDKVRYDTPGYKHFEKPVDPAWLQTATETIVSAEIDKLYVDPADKATLGFILTRMGFERQ